MLFCTGCFYVQPAKRTPENQPPVIESVQPIEGTLMFTNDNARITVIARDPEDDVLEFIWTPPPFAEWTQNTTEVGEDAYVSRVDIRYNEDLDGELILLTILDDGGATDLSWQVEGL